MQKKVYFAVFEIVRRAGKHFITKKSFLVNHGSRKRKRDDSDHNDEPNKKKRRLNENNHNKSNWQLINISCNNIFLLHFHKNLCKKHCKKIRPPLTQRQEAWRQEAQRQVHRMQEALKKHFVLDPEVFDKELQSFLRSYFLLEKGRLRWTKLSHFFVMNFFAD